jgi:hypothetical protein
MLIPSVFFLSLSSIVKLLKWKDNMWNVPSFHFYNVNMISENYLMRTIWNMCYATWFHSLNLNLISENNRKFIAVSAIRNYKQRSESTYNTNMNYIKVKKQTLHWQSDESTRDILTLLQPYWLLVAEIKTSCSNVTGFILEYLKFNILKQKH